VFVGDAVFRRNVVGWSNILAPCQFCYHGYMPDFAHAQLERFHTAAAAAVDDARNQIVRNQLARKQVVVHNSEEDLGMMNQVQNGEEEVLDKMD